MPGPVKGLRERLRDGEDIIVAEGYIFEFERRGYLRAGCFVPEVVIEHPEHVKMLHKEFVHAGSDVVLAFTYYGHREKLKIVGRESELEDLNIKALKIAREVADETGTLMAGNICNTIVYHKDKPETVEIARQMFKEQIEWAVQYGADFIVAETFNMYAEAKLALDCIKEYGNGLPAVVSLITPLEKTLDGVEFPEACRLLENAGADVVGLNCGRGPDSMMPLIKGIRKVCKGPICMLPVPHRTTLEQPTVMALKEPSTGKTAFPYDLPAFACSRSQIAKFAREAKEVGVQYIGLCCGNASHYLRVVAEEYGRKPPASRFSPDMSQHFVFGDKEHVKNYHAESLLPVINTQSGSN